MNRLFLAGKTVLLTRPRIQAEESRPLFEAAGAEVLVQPALEILPAEIGTEQLEPEKLCSYSRILFSSANGVHFFVGAVNSADRRDGGTRLEQLKSVPLAAVGPGTASVLERYGLRAGVVPTLHSAEGLVEALTNEARSGRFLAVRGDRGRKTLRDGLTALGGEVEELGVYRTEEIKTPDAETARRMEAGEISYTLVTSSATAEGTVRLFGARLRRTTLVSISPLTSAALEKTGYPANLEAGEATIPGMLEKIKESA